MSNEVSLSDATIEHNRESLVADLKRIVADANDLLKKASNSSSEEHGTARQRIIVRLSDARARASDAKIALTRIP